MTNRKINEDINAVLQSFNEGVVLQKRNAENKLAVGFGRKTSIYENDPKMAKKESWFSKTRFGNALANTFTLSSKIIRILLLAIVAIVFILGVVFTAAMAIKVTPDFFTIPIIICSAILIIVGIWKA